MDPAVSRTLFAEQVERMRQSARFKKGVWSLVSADFPDLVVEMPHPTGARRRFRFRCDDWDEKPPSVKSIDTDGNVLEGQPSGDRWMGLNTGWGLCAAGTREYHAHHTEDPWAQHRDDLDLVRIVVRAGWYYRRSSA